MSADAGPALQRSSGTARISFKCRASGTCLDELYQQGCSKVRFPRKQDGTPEAVLLNTAGGLADGDTLTSEIHWRGGARATVTSQAAERVYRAAGGGSARVTTRLRVDADAVACWLPQETIVFDGARLARSLEIEVAPDARLLALESTVFGRRAMGETVSRGRVSDRWRLRIGGRLVFADHFLLDDALTGPIDTSLARGPVADGAHCLATLVVVAPDSDRIVTAAREAQFESSSESPVKERAHIGATLLDGLAVLRIVAADGAAMRAGLTRLVTLAGETSGITLPRVWHC
ncbi:urease accessory protein UreD [Lentisalinibacter salinarum]|uniref:urease accessory protein UreD n=1 Tax=Lentisalinibacter salinarum TaxID=2992239 RepID=UPI00386CA742